MIYRAMSDSCSVWVGPGDMFDSCSVWGGPGDMSDSCSVWGGLGICLTAVQYGGAWGYV